MNLSLKTLRLANPYSVLLGTQPDERHPYSFTGTNVFEIIFARVSGLSRWQSDLESDETQ